MQIVRKHSKYSASSAERWTQCFGSVELSEGLPDKETQYSKEGTLAHLVLEHALRALIYKTELNFELVGATPEMKQYAGRAARFIHRLYEEAKGSEILVETKISLPFIHPEMFGTFDGAVVDHFGTLHVLDFKYGQGHAVSAKENLQMIFYGLGLAHKYDFNFKDVKLYIIQPRIRGYDGPTFWPMDILELKNYTDFFKRAVENIEKYPDKYVEGTWCFFCKAKGICPLKKDAQFEKAKKAFVKAGR